MRHGTRRKRAGMWIAGVAVIASIAASYHLTHPPELVWWTSPEIGTTGRQVRVRIPQGWDGPNLDTIQVGAELCTLYMFRPVDRRPGLLRQLIPHRSEDADLDVRIDRVNTIPASEYDSSVKRSVRPDGKLYALRTLQLNDHFTLVSVVYGRTDQRAFDTTYKQICNSLRIE